MVEDVIRAETVSSRGPDRRTGPSYPAWARTLYAGGVFFVGLLTSLLALVASGPLFVSGETWEGLAIWWFMAWPSFLVLAGLSALAYPLYRRSTTWRRLLTMILVNSTMVVLLGLGLTYGLSSLFPTIGRWLLAWL